MRKRSWATLLLAAVIGVAAVAVLVAPRGPPQFVWTNGNAVFASLSGEGLGSYVTLTIGPASPDSRDTTTPIAPFRSVRESRELGGGSLCLIAKTSAWWPRALDWRPLCADYVSAVDGSGACDAAGVTWWRCDLMRVR